MATKKEEQALNVDEVQALIKKMLDEAKAEAAKIVEEAKAASGVKSNWSTEDKAAHEAEMNELVEVKLFKDNDKYKDPVFVGCNGETIAIERGIRVKIKRKFAEILENSDNQDYETSKLIERKSAEFSKTGL
jgi:hypothetical protein